MPGPVVHGIGGSGIPVSPPPGQLGDSRQPFLPLLAEGRIKLLLLNSGVLLLSRLRTTTDWDGDPAYQLIRPQCVIRRYQGRRQGNDVPEYLWQLEPFLLDVTPQENLVVFKSAVASIMDPQPDLLRNYTTLTCQECPPPLTPVERLKQAFQEFTDSIECEGEDPSLPGD